MCSESSSLPVPSDCTKVPVFRLLNTFFFQLIDSLNPPSGSTFYPNTNPIWWGCSTGGSDRAPVYMFIGPEGDTVLSRSNTNPFNPAEPGIAENKSTRDTYNRIYHSKQWKPGDIRLHSTSSRTLANQSAGGHQYRLQPHLSHDITQRNAHQSSWVAIHIHSGRYSKSKFSTWIWLSKLTFVFV